MIDMGKIIRNTPISAAARLAIARGFADYFTKVDAQADRKTFMQIATGKLEDDQHTSAWSLLKEKEDEKV